MAGDGEPFTYIPFFFSDLFEFGDEVVGDTDPRLELFFDWREENQTDVIYYLDGSRVRGAMMCNMFGKVGRRAQTDSMRKAHRRFARRDSLDRSVDVLGVGVRHVYRGG